MIKNKKELNYYLAADKFALGKDYSRPKVNDEIWKYQILLRKVEFYKNTTKTSVLKMFVLRFYQLRLHRLGLKLGFDIGINVFGPGLRINHYGNLVVNGGAKVGKWCDIHQGVNIGSNNSNSGGDLVPNIGSNVWIGPGAKLFGEIEVGEGVVIGANAVVNKSFSSFCTVAGIPAVVVNSNGTNKINVAASPDRMEFFYDMFDEYKEYQ